MYNPYLLGNIEEVSKRIFDAVKNNESIGVSYDADSDGITSGTMMVRYLKYHTANDIKIIYNQREKGHGVGEQEIPDDINLLIVVDSSTNEIEKCLELTEKGIDIVILDHHPKFKDNPYATIVNPQICNYPNKSLSGAGVVFKTCQVLDDLFETEYAFNFIDLCGIGMYADVMDMDVPENRAMVYLGLNNINNLGIRAIIEKTKSNNINAEFIAYKIAPIINACARMSRIELIIELLLEDDYEKCLVLAKECIKLNEERKKTQIKLFKKIKDRIDLNHKIIIIKTTEQDKIDKGFNGLLATQVAEKYKRPTLVVKEHQDKCAGSGRSIGGIQLKDVLKEAGLFELLEGHSEAFGVEFKTENMDTIYEYADKNIVEYNDGTKIFRYDLEINKEEITKDLAEEIEKFNYISGKNCETPKFLIKNLTVLDKKVMGKLLDTVKITTDKLDLMKFKVNEFYADSIDTGDYIDVIGSVNINRWYNWGIREYVETIQLFIDDYRISDI